MTTMKGVPDGGTPALSRRAFVSYGIGMGLAGSLGIALMLDWRPTSGHSASSASPEAAASPVVCPSSPVASPSVGSPTAAVTIRMTNALRFNPSSVTIRVGQTVTWMNASAIPHTSTCDPAKNPVARAFPDYVQLPAGAATWDSGLLQPGKSFSHTFTVPGTYHYICIPHVVSGMRGTIVVHC